MEQPQSTPMTDAIAQSVVDKLPMEETDPRLLPGFHFSLFWGLVRFDFNQMPVEPAMGMPTVITLGGGVA